MEIVSSSHAAAAAECISNDPERGPILYFSSVDVSLPNGPGVNEREFVRSLQARFGDRCICVLPRPAHWPTELSSKGLHLCPSHRQYRALRYLLFVVCQTVTVLWLIKRRKVRLAVARLGPLPVAAYAVQRWSRAPLALKTVGRFWRDANRGGPAHRRAQRLTDAMSRSVLGQAFAIDTVTKKFYDRIREVVGTSEKLLHLENAVNVDLFHPQTRHQCAANPLVKDKWPVIGYAGGLPSKRGARELVEAAHRLRPRFPNICALVVGSDPGLEDVRRWAEEHGIADACRFVGTVPYEKVPDYINLMDVGIAFDDPDRAAEIGNSSQKVRQYLACGVPVVTLMAGNEFVADHSLGSRVDPRNLLQVVDAISHWVNLDQNEREQFTKHAREYSVSELSTERALGIRLDFWRARLNHERG